MPSRTDCKFFYGDANRIYNPSKYMEFKNLKGRLDGDSRRHHELSSSLYPHVTNTETPSFPMSYKTCDEKEGNAAACVEGEHSLSLMSSHRESLPVWQQRDNIINSVENNAVTVIVGETGSGKTTQVPQMLLEHFYRDKKSFNSPYDGCTIAVTQPRRIAAITLATRISSELKKYVGNTNLHRCLEVDYERHRSDSPHSIPDMYSVGGLVGYSVRFQTQASRGTRIKFLTDGTLLREALIDPYLRRYRVIIIDEAHERSLQTDIILGLLKRLLAKRSDRRIVVMSATLDYHCFTHFFGQGNVLFIPGRQHPVDLYQTCESVKEPLEILINTIVQIHVGRPPAGDILAFLPGQEEINAAIAMLQERNTHMTLAFSRFHVWWKMLEKIKKIQQKPLLWREFLLGQWDTEPQTQLPLKNRDSLGQSTSAQTISSKLQRFLNTLSHEEQVIAKECRYAFTKHGSHSISNASVDNPIATHEFQRLVMTSPSFILDDSKVYDLFERSFSSKEGSTEMTGHCSMLLIPLFAALPYEKQQLAFLPAPLGCRKVILATNIAETSLTIPGIRYVVDTGLYKNKTFNPLSGVEVLKIDRISRAMANQRAGRAGREAAGECFRLYSEEEYYAMSIHADPEIKRSNLTQVVLELKLLNIQDLSTFSFIAPPSTTSLAKAEENLKRLGGIDLNGITPLGKKLVAFPLPSEYAKFLLDSVDMGCTAEALTIVSILTSDSILSSSWRGTETRLPQGRTDAQEDSQRVQRSQLAKKKIVSVYGDHLTFLNAYILWDSISSTSKRIEFCKTFGLNHNNLCKVKRVRKQIKDILLGPSIQLNCISSCLSGSGFSTSHQTEGSEPDAIRQCLVKSFPSNIARLESLVGSPESTDATSHIPTRYLIQESRNPVFIHPCSSLFQLQKKPEVIVFNDLVETTKLYVRIVTSVEDSWVKLYHPQLAMKSSVMPSTTLSAKALTFQHDLLNNKPEKHRSTFKRHGSKLLVNRKASPKIHSMWKKKLHGDVCAKKNYHDRKTSQWLQKTLHL